EERVLGRVPPGVEGHAARLLVAERGALLEKLGRVLAVLLLLLLLPIAVPVPAREALKGRGRHGGDAVEKGRCHGLGRGRGQPAVIVGERLGLARRRTWWSHSRLLLAQKVEAAAAVAPLDKVGRRGVVARAPRGQLVNALAEPLGTERAAVVVRALVAV